MLGQDPSASHFNAQGTPLAKCFDMQGTSFLSAVCVRWRCACVRSHDMQFLAYVKVYILENQGHKEQKFLNGVLYSHVVLYFHCMEKSSLDIVQNI